MHKVVDEEEEELYWEGWKTKLIRFGRSLNTWEKRGRRPACLFVNSGCVVIKQDTSTCDFLSNLISKGQVKNYCFFL
jgi:hypothetical protein